MLSASRPVKSASADVTTSMTTTLTTTMSRGHARSASGSHKRPWPTSVRIGSIWDAPAPFVRLAC